MSVEQRRALDAALREAPRPNGTLPVERMREGFATFMGSFPVAAVVSRPAPPRAEQAPDGLIRLVSDRGRF
jgi:hypothetical protein